VTLAISSSAAEAASTAAGAARAAGARISFAVNHRPALRPSVPALAAAARAADLVFVSLEDAEAVFATDQESAVVGTIGDGREVVVTAGGRGATVHWQGRACRLAAPEVLVVDAAGAGDALAGAYLAARMVGAEPPEALRQGVAAASLSCTAQGCALSYPEAAAIGNVAMSLS
jgi:2-dehydro-3-deoxygluconokinase